MTILYCDTEALAALLPDEPANQMALQTGLSAKNIERIKRKESVQTEEEYADKLLTALGLPHLYSHLEFTSEKKLSTHGIYGYENLGCRCAVCKTSKRQKSQRYRKKLRDKKGGSR